MTGISRKDVDMAGDIFIDGFSENVFVENHLAVLDGAKIKNHGGPPHDVPTISATEKNVFINNKKVIRQNDIATCAHLASGSSTVFIG